MPSNPNIPFEEGIVPNRFVGRTFILPNQGQRDRAVAMKLNIIPDVVDGKRIVIVEDSVVRGTTTRSKMRAIRRAGAKEIHLRVSCPPIRHPCFYGIDFPTKQELIAHNRTVDADPRIPRSGQPGVSLAGRNARLHEIRRSEIIAPPAGAGTTKFPSISRRANSVSSAISFACSANSLFFFIYRTSNHCDACIVTRAASASR